MGPRQAVSTELARATIRILISWSELKYCLLLALGRGRPLIVRGPVPRTPSNIDCWLLAQIFTTTVWRRLWERQFSMHLRSRNLPRPSASSPLDNRALPMANTSQVPDLEGLHHEIHGMAEQMRVMNENNARLIQLLAAANPQPPAAPSVPDVERSRHSNRSRDRSHNVSTERARGRRRAPSPSLRERSSSSESSQTQSRVRKGRSPRRGDHTEARDKSTSQTDPPFTERVLGARISSKFKLPTQLSIYEGKTDPMDHLDSYKILMSLQGCLDEKNASHLFTVHQKEIESLKDFVKRFNQAILEVEDPSDKVIIMVMMEGLRPGPLFDSLSKNVPETLSALQSKADKHIAAKEEEIRYKRPDRDPKRSNNRRPRTPPRRPEFILPPLSAPVAQGLPEKYVTDRPPPNSPERRYGDNRPTAGNIQTIHGGFGSGGCSTSSKKRHARSVFRLAEEEIYNLSSPCVGDQPPITFSNDDLRGLHLPHDDALVVSAVIANFNVQRILIDTGSSADILFISAFEKIKIRLDKLHPFHTPLIGFGGNMTHPLGWINLPITLGTEQHQTTVWQNFIVVDYPSPYNAILGRPTLGGIKAITSTYHLKMKFPTLTRIGEVKGDQKMAGDDTRILRDEIEHLILEDPRDTENTKPLEEVVPISIHPNYPDRQVMIGIELTNELRIALIDFLQKNSDVFAWSQRDVPGIDPKVAMHKMFTKPEYSPVRQKRRKFAPERLKVIEDEISKLIRANVIKMYPPDVEKTSFIMERGLYCYKVMPFGLKNAGATYQRLVNKMFNAQIGKTMEVYIDDMLVKSLQAHNHIAHLEEAFNILRRHRMMLNPSKCIFGVSSGKFLGFLVTKRGIEVNPDQIQALIAMRSPRNIREVQQLTGRVTALNRLVSKSADKCLLFFKILRKSQTFQWSEESENAFRQLKEYLGSPPLLSVPTADEDLYVYLSASPAAISAVLVQEEGLVIRAPSGEQMEYAIRMGFQATNNEAEYEALLAGLRVAIELRAQSLEVFSDSQLVVNQVQGDYLAKDSRMIAYLGEVKAVSAKIKEFKIHQIPREDNKKADALANLASTFEFIFDRCIPLEFLANPSIGVANQILQTEENPTWVHEIIAYLQKGILPKDKLQARRLQYRSSRFCIFKGKLYKRSFSGPLLRCLRPEEVEYVLREIHEGICGNHSGARRLPHTEMVPMSSPWLFAQWGIDILGPLPQAPLQRKFLVVAIDYFTKWIEAQPLAKITEKNTRDFVWKHLVCRFGVPKVIISDNARQFDNDRFRLFCSDLAISHHFSSPSHPQANGQVEITNRTILRNLKARLEWSKNEWAENLLSILWAYHTTSRIPTGETPYSMVFGTELVVPVEIGMPSFRISNFDKESNEAELRLNLDLLEEKRENAELRQMAYKCQVANYYNQRVRHRSFLPGDLVLRKVTLPTKELNAGKLGPTWEGPYKSRQSLPTRDILVRGPKRKGTFTSLECRAFEKIISINEPRDNPVAP
ncbi:hypothetical protein Acr_27g0001610 [Actinidia rufa]|uniref:Uncharacterized protein n=1 Tax=Actinidia rufa TaxID=165716 RepID=A0A7J0H5S0_9ERIC|nr:hypothetical protein Acr_27g0001610 [Actinidia rufa]